MPSDDLTSGEMSRASGLSPKALRLYHANGLLVPARVDDATGYRVYAPGQVARGRTIALLRRLELPLDQIADVIDAPPHDARGRLLRWWHDRAAVIEDVRAEVEARFTADVATPGGAQPRAVRRRRQPDRKVATMTSEPDQAALVATTAADALAVRAHLTERGARFADEYWVVYHRVPGPGSQYRVETCVPYEGTIDPGPGVALRVDPAGEEHFLPVTARECRYPDIVGAHAAVIEAARAAGVRSPVRREIYPVPWSDDDDADAVVAEVAVRA
jgi:DNA-binding transcriptional MerR regulator